jgi:DNA-directed RNA polymerase specialized sigma24 family protein
MRPEDERAFADYVRARTSALLQYAYLLSGNARDLVQRALAKAYGDWHHAEHEGVDTYVKSSILRDHLRLRRRLHRDRAPVPSDRDSAWG